METDKLLTELGKFLQKQVDLGHIDIIKTEKSKSAEIDYFELARFSPDIAEQLLDQPEEVLKALQVSFDNIYSLSVKCHIKKLPDSNKHLISNLKEELINKYIKIEGVVRGVTSIEPIVTMIKYECPSCGNILSVLQVSEFLSEPSRCGCGRKGKFKLIDTEKINHFTVSVEEAPDLAQSQNMSTIEIIVKDDLADPALYHRLYTGVRLSINGILRADHYYRGKQKLTKMYFYLDADHIEILGDDLINLNIREKDKQKFYAFSKRKECLKLLANNIFSGIYGYTDKKMLMTTMLVGGVRKFRGNKLIRDNINIIMVGDAGMGKTVMGKKLIRFTPRHRYVSGGQNSGRTGITYTIDQDENTKKRYIVAGAIPRCHKGICFIDEIDGIPDDESKSVNEAMENQEITIDKSVHGKLKAETALLFGGNPKNGNFDIAEPLATQIDLPPPIMSRADAILVFRTTYDTSYDENLAKTLVFGENSGDELTDEFIMKYMQFAKKLKPELSKEAGQYIVNKYVELRKKFKDDESHTVPITARVLNSFVRVSEAISKLKLKATVEEYDAKQAVALLWKAHLEVAMDNEGRIDGLSIDTGMSVTASQLRQEISNILATSGKSKFGIVEIQKEISAKMNFSDTTFDDVIEKMKRSGEIYEPRRGEIAKI